MKKSNDKYPRDAVPAATRAQVQVLFSLIFPINDPTSNPTLAVKPMTKGETIWT